MSKTTPATGTSQTQEELPLSPKSKPGTEPEGTVREAPLDKRINPLQNTPGGTGASVEPDLIDRTLDTVAIEGVPESRTPENEFELTAPAEEKKPASK